MDEHRQQLAQQVGACAGESVGQDLLQVDTWALVIAWSFIE
ncbi:hypothetical protein [Rhodococcus opacus]|nr:hypothetical protein [Rhodococcus opacus]UZG60253.1 hypothetical protein ONE62_41980 [Rhodococcus opacus]